MKALIPNFRGCYEYIPRENPLAGLSKTEKEAFAFAYMEMWVNQEEFDDFSIMHEAGDAELMASALVSAGAIDSKHCHAHCAGIEKIIEGWARKFDRLSFKKQRKRYDAAFKECMTVECKECNHTQFPSDSNFKIYKESLKKKCWSCGAKNPEVEPWQK